MKTCIKYILMLKSTRDLIFCLPFYPLTPLHTTHLGLGDARCHFVPCSSMLTLLFSSSWSAVSWALAAHTADTSTLFCGYLWRLNVCFAGRSWAGAAATYPSSSGSPYASPLWSGLLLTTASALKEHSKPLGASWEMTSDLSGLAHGICWAKILSLKLIDDTFLQYLQFKEFWSKCWKLGCWCEISTPSPVFAPEKSTQSTLPLCTPCQLQAFLHSWCL